MGRFGRLFGEKPLCHAVRDPKLITAGGFEGGIHRVLEWFVDR